MDITKKEKEQYRIPVLPDMYKGIQNSKVKRKLQQNSSLLSNMTVNRCIQGTQAKWAPVK